MIFINDVKQLTELKNGTMIKFKCERCNRIFTKFYYRCYYNKKPKNYLMCGVCRTIVYKKSKHPYTDKEHAKLIEKYEDFKQLKFNDYYKYTCSMCNTEYIQRYIDRETETMKVLKDTGKIICFPCLASLRVKEFNKTEKGKMIRERNKKIQHDRYDITTEKGKLARKERSEFMNDKYNGVNGNKIKKQISDTLKEFHKSEEGKLAEEKHSEFMKNYYKNNNNRKRLSDLKIDFLNTTAGKIVREEHSKCTQQYSYSSARYFYNFIFFNSITELEFYIYNIDFGNNIQKNYKYFEYTYNNEPWHKYTPDFILNGEFIEIKGRWLLNEKVYSKKRDYINARIQFAKSIGVKIIYDDELNYCKEYINKTYGPNYLERFKLINKINGIFITESTILQNLQISFGFYMKTINDYKYTPYDKIDDDNYVVPKVENSVIPNFNL